MTRNIAINGTKLDEVRMPLWPPADGTIASLSYPLSQIRLSRQGSGMRLIVPAYLAVELYRIGILPQDANLPVEVTIGGRSSGWYTVTDVRYPDWSASPFGEVTFTLTLVVQETVRPVASESPLSQTAAAGGTYVTDITHYLDEAGELLPMPGPARKLASFVTLLIEAATGSVSAHYHDSRVRCRTKACRGTILTMLPQNADEIAWHCPVCGHHGVIRNWKDTKWNQLKSSERPE